MQRKKADTIINIFLMPEANTISQQMHGPGPSDHHRMQHWFAAHKEWVLAIVSFVLFIMGLAFDYIFSAGWFSGDLRFAWYAAAYLPVGLPVVARGLKLALKGDLFTEFFLMSIATIGAFYLGEFPEGVAVMVFYAVGELFQAAAVNSAKRSIKALLDVRPSLATVRRGANYVSADPVTINVDDVVQVKVGERVPLDGVLITGETSFNTAALTGESAPSRKIKGDTILAGMINEEKVVEIRVTKPFNDSALSRILTLVQNAQGRKAKTELFIRRFAKIYTPIVVLLAIALTLLPYLFVANYDFEVWLYRALIFLVISCPCALVVAIPLGYFGGIGAASKNGVLFKGASYLDRMTRVNTVVFDKTGTLTKGVFTVQQVVNAAGGDDVWHKYIAAAESQSTHPVAKAIVKFMKGWEGMHISSLEEIKGHGVRAIVDGRTVLVGNLKLLRQFSVPVNADLSMVEDTLVVAAVDEHFVGYITIADEIRHDALETIGALQRRGIDTILLSGDKQSVVSRVAKVLGINQAMGELLPEDKLQKLEEIKKQGSRVVAFVGDGINDAPVLSASDVGIAMGGMGSDVAIETADVVIQTDQLSKIVTAIKIGNLTQRVVWQNIIFAFAVKIIVMAFGAWGVASMWEAVFADVGVALLAIVNAIRVQRST